MAKTVCKAVKQRIVDRMGRPSIEWHKDGVPQYYCYGYADPMTEIGRLITVMQVEKKKDITTVILAFM